MNPNIKELDLLVDWAVNRMDCIRNYLNKGWLQLDAYSLFTREMKDIYYNNQRCLWGNYIQVLFNHYLDKKTHFCIESKFKGERIIRYEKFSKAVWDYLKNKSDSEQHQEYEQLALL
ncbi:hypothetical protein [Cytobacillus purgationiresistens]|uniref:Uncharacterized protein n=1 Tax=Cytobacillus purgationiresistens TaxID=863449 RepID=A0ABU0AFS9_9BACI|nr:hypothetical protein [Cytobacillus purgationiresistens]MDQ0270116.1 hypothetical protein [Cytobacillus purgationiresistens]